MFRVLELRPAKWAEKNRLVEEAWSVLRLHVANSEIEHAILFNTEEGVWYAMECVGQVRTARAEIRHFSSNPAVNYLRHQA